MCVKVCREIGANCAAQISGVAAENLSFNSTAGKPRAVRPRA